MASPEPPDKNSLQNYLEQLLAEEAKKNQEKAPGERPAPKEGGQAPAAKAIPETTTTPEPPKPEPPKVGPKEPPAKSPEWDALGSLLTQALGDAKEPTPQETARPAPPTAPPPAAAPAPPASPQAVAEARKEADKILSEARKEAEEIRRQAAAEAEAARALARNERETAHKARSEAMAKLAELDVRLHAAVGKPAQAPPAEPLPPLAPPAPPVKAETPAPPPSAPLAAPTSETPEKASKRPWLSFLKGKEAQKSSPPSPVKSPSTPAPPAGVAADPTGTFQGEVQLKITAPVDWPRLRRLEQALTGRLGLTYSGTRSTPEGTFMLIKLVKPSPLVQTLIETELVIAILPAGQDKSGARRLQLTLGEPPKSDSSSVRPDPPNPRPPPPPAPPRLRRYQGQVSLTVSPLPSLQDLHQAQAILRQLAGANIVNTTATPDRRGAIFTLALQNVPLESLLEEAFPGGRFQQDEPNKFALVLPQGWPGSPPSG